MWYSRIGVSLVKVGGVVQYNGRLLLRSLVGVVQ